MANLLKTLGIAIPLSILSIGGFSQNKINDFKDTTLYEHFLNKDSIPSFKKTKYNDNNVYIEKYVLDKKRDKYFLNLSRTIVRNSTGDTLNITQVKNNYLQKNAGLEKWERREIKKDIEGKLEYNNLISKATAEAKNKNYVYDSLGRLKRIDIAIHNGKQEKKSVYYFYIGKSEKVAGGFKDNNNDSIPNKGDEIYSPAEDKWFDYSLEK